MIELPMNCKSLHFNIESMLNLSQSQNQKKRRSKFKHSNEWEVLNDLTLHFLKVGKIRLPIICLTFKKMIGYKSQNR